MKFNFSNIKPNIVNFILDLTYLYFSIGAILIYFQNALLNKFYLIYAPLIFITITYFSGNYSSNLKLKKHFKKIFLLLASLATSIFIYYLIKDFYISIYWLLVTIINLTIQRLIINYKYLNFTRSKKESILIIGGAGYIGSHLVKILINSGKSVKVLDRLMFGDSSLSAFKDHPNFEMIVGDATDIQCLTIAVSGTYAVIHLSGLVGDPACAVDNAFTRHQNINATQLIRDLSQSMGVKRLIFSSSCSVYGVSEHEVTENDKLNPVSLYAETKMESEIDLLRSNKDDFIVTILRFATVFGDSARPRFDLVANLFAAQAYVDKKITIIGPDQWRPFIHVADLAKAIKLVLDAPANKIKNQIFNVGDSRLNMTLGQLGEKVKEVAKNFNIDLEIKLIQANVQDKRNYAVSFNKITQILGFKASIMMEEGLSEIIKKFEIATYKEYKNIIYSNLLTTKALIPEFYNITNRKKLYAPISENSSASFDT
jgi:nucleoside-diphosphate-sugar epimerase